ncbi:MAG TPA: flagellar FlbD family protein [Bacillota bacterium]|nr:flagellar FlbD family protein [Bacillota bacterium]
MITLTRLNGSQFVVNSDLVELMEASPDTVITLTTGRKLVVVETVDQVIARVKEFRRALVTSFEGTGS